jgi:hypothetical protein
MYNLRTRKPTNFNVDDAFDTIFSECDDDVKNGVFDEDFDQIFEEEKQKQVEHIKHLWKKAEISQHPQKLDLASDLIRCGVELVEFLEKHNEPSPEFKNIVVNRCKTFIEDPLGSSKMLVWVWALNKLQPGEAMTYLEKQMEGLKI